VNDQLHLTTSCTDGSRLPIMLEQGEKQAVRFYPITDLRDADEPLACRKHYKTLTRGDAEQQPPDEDVPPIAVLDGASSCDRVSAGLVSPTDQLPTNRNICKKSGPTSAGGAPGAPPSGPSKLTHRKNFYQRLTNQQLQVAQLLFRSAHTSAARRQLAEDVLANSLL
jgi:hypothetical protein